MMVGVGTPTAPKLLWGKEGGGGGGGVIMTGGHAPSVSGTVVARVTPIVTVASVVGATAVDVNVR